MAMQTPSLRFDASLPAFVEAVNDIMGADWLAERRGGILRDASAILTLITFQPLAESCIAALRDRLRQIGAYVDLDEPVLTDLSSYDQGLLDPEKYSFTEVQLGQKVKAGLLLLDRRIIGADWLATPSQELEGQKIPVLVFASIKGGVGRSTALSVTASHLADQGLRVLTVDLDLEAPGLGSMLLGPDLRPKFGTLDFYVERGTSAFRDDDFTDLLEASDVATSAAPVYVVPAFGQESLRHPANVLGKISRAYIEDTDNKGNILTFLDRTRLLIQGLKAVRDFDVILVDGRAGLHETLASSILGLRADVLLFGVNEPQTFEGYLPLLSSLRHAVEVEPDFLLRLHMVQGKANGKSPDDVKLFRDRSHALFRAALYGAPPASMDQLEAETDTWFAIEDSDGPHYPWVVYESEIYREFDPGSRHQLLSRTTFAEPYADFLRNIDDMLELTLGSAV